MAQRGGDVNTQYEYMEDVWATVEEINCYAAQGWRVVSAKYIKNEDHWCVLLERVKVSP